MVYKVKVHLARKQRTSRVPIARQMMVRSDHIPHRIPVILGWTWVSCRCQDLRKVELVKSSRPKRTLRASSTKIKSHRTRGRFRSNQNHTERTFIATVHAHRREPVVTDEVSRFIAIGNVLSRPLIDVEFGEAEVDHVDSFMVRLEAEDTVAELDVSVENASAVHES